MRKQAELVYNVLWVLQTFDSAGNYLQMWFRRSDGYISIQVLESYELIINNSDKKMEI